MTKAKTTKKEETKDVAKQQGGEVAIPSGIDLSASAKHAENETIEMQDQALPWLKMCQKNTPELDDEDEFADLEYGDLFLPTGEIWKGDVGAIFVPFYYGRTFVEWRPRSAGGGFIDDHGLQKGKELAKTCTRAENKKVATVLPSGNELIETAYWAGFIVDMDGDDVTLHQAIFALTSTGLSASKDWNTKVMKYRFGGAPNYIRWARPWRIRTEKTSNEAGKFVIPKINLYKPEDHDGPFHTFDLPGGVELWQECDRLAKEFKDGFRLQAPADEKAPDEATNNQGAKDDGEEPY